MYTHSILIALSVIFVFLAPILYLNSMQKRKEKKKIDKLTILAQKNKLELDLTENLPILLLGLDIDSRKLLVVELLNNEQSVLIDLREIISCEINIARPKSSGGGISLIALQLKSKVINSTGTRIIFYNEDAEVHPDAERRLQAAEKWKKLISENIALQ